MSAELTAEVLQDELAVSLARIIAAANKSAREAGVNIAESLVTITQINNGDHYWQVNYGLKDYINQRGGDVLVEVDAKGASIKRLVRSQ